jgi:hypothetical protein
MFGSWRTGSLAERWLAGAVFVAALLSSAAASAGQPGITAPRPISSIEVAYPPQAHGSAVVELLLAEDGTVAQSEVPGRPQS